MKTAAACAGATALLLVAVPGASASPCGPGELVLPGTATCLRLGGVLRAEAAAARTSPIVAPAPETGGRRSAALRNGARVDLDARVPTAAGPLRAYLAVRTDGFGRR